MDHGAILREALVLIGTLAMISPARAATQQHEVPATARIIDVAGHDLQQVIDSAPPHSTIICDPNRQLTLSTPIRIRKPLTLRGLNAKLPEKLSKTSLLSIHAERVTVSNFVLTGNADSVPQPERAPLMVIEAGDFRIESGQFFNSSKDGIMITPGTPGEGDLVGGVVRDIVGHKIIRDLVSIGGAAGGARKVRNLLVDNVRLYGSDLRGAVEVSDGSENITVRKVYAEDAIYAVDVQDHGGKQESDRHVVIEDVYALRCRHAIRTANSPRGHAYLTLRDITADQCAAPVRITNIDNVVIVNVRIINHKGDSQPVEFRNCNGLSIRDVIIDGTAHRGPAVLLVNCDSVIVDGVSLRGSTPRLTSAVCYRISGDEAFSGLRITNISARNVTDAGILLEKNSGKATLSDYIVSGNLSSVRDAIQGKRALVANNLP